MRIAYVSLNWPRTLTSGVGKKINQQISFWENAGHTVHIFMHMHAYEPREELLAGSVYPFTKKKGFTGKILTEINRMKATRTMLSGIQAYQPDIIYLRNGMYSYPLHHLARIAPVVSEINTNDIQQHRRLGIVLSTYNLLTRSIILSRSKGLVTVSHELASIPAYAKYRLPTCVIANGFDVDSVPVLPSPNNTVPRLVFIGSPDCPWHGVDKLVPFAVSHPGLIVDIIGYDQIDGITSLPDNLNLHGYLKREAYQAILGQADAAIGSLGLHRIGIHEASPLKTRECLSYGIPMILPYHDTDLADLDCDFLLHLPNQEDNLLKYGDEVERFLFRVRGKRADRQRIQPRIDYIQKEQERLEFLQEILNKTDATQE